ncbi:GGDEF domain-containing protein [Methylophaga sp. OBS3]|uniref:GGDEF domain-containing protein n=1 Tax=Methylophaga sp. OBS3 TaxID=2991934 RepID=UPI002254B424|nr:GGDEF domain-containing protein [Methylophaga sp. OBS3]MCX4190003.1 GGDEF domain-containing protein [Methylophaga sp. OBS3]
MQHLHNSNQIIDNLAEFTGHQDRDVLEESLLKTLNELFPAHSLDILQVNRLEKSQEAKDLVAPAKAHSKFDNESPELKSLIRSAIDDREIKQYCDKQGEFFTIIPALDSQGGILAILLHRFHEKLSDSDQRLVSGLLKVYANYLGLINKTQRDKLTSLFNRETLDQQISQVLNNQRNNFLDKSVEPQDSRRHAATKDWLGIIDIDYFKQINDNYGHLYGDEVIILVSRLMTSGVLRDNDLVFRFGGEEFVVLLKSAGEADAFMAFERLRLIVANQTFPQLDQITISIGFVEVALQSSTADVIGQADNALYYAKQNGRNQVHSYHSLVSEGKITESRSSAHDNDVELF